MTNTVPGVAAVWTRAAVFTRSPATKPWPSAPSVTAVSPVGDPGACGQFGIHIRPEPRHRRDQLESGAHGALRVVLLGTGAPQTAMTASPMNFSTVPP